MNNLKALILTGALLALLSSPCFAWGVVGMGGGVASALSCTSCESPTAQFNSSKTTTAGSLQARGYAWEFTLESQTCITGISWEVFDTDNAGNIKYEIWSGTHADGPSALVEDCTVTVSYDNIPTNYSQGVETEGTFSSIKTLSAGTYFVVMLPGTMTSVGYGYISESGQNFWHTDNGGTSWSANIYPGQVRVLGCSPN